MSGNGIGFLGLLTIAFVVLKVLGFITWSWFWVVSPVSLPVGAGLIIAGTIGIGKYLVKRKHRRS